MSTTYVFFKSIDERITNVFYDKQKVCQNIFYISSHRNTIVLHSAVSNSHVLFFCKHFHLIEYLYLTVLLLDFIADLDLEFVWSNVRF